MELGPNSHNPEHEPRGIDLAKHILRIDGVAIGAVTAGLASAWQ